MSITITITDPTPAQIAALFGTLDTAKSAGNAAKKDTKVSSPPADTPESGSQTSDSGQTAPTDASPSDAVPSLDDVKAAAQALVGKNGRDALAELVEEFKAKNLSTIAESDRAAFIAKCKSKSE